MSGKVTLEQVQKCLFTIARTSSVELNAKSKLPAYLLGLDFSPELLDEHRTLYKKSKYSSSAQLTTQHTADELRGQLMLTVINFPRKQIGPKMSDCLVCGVQASGNGVDAEIKRTSIVCIRPFIDHLKTREAAERLVGAPVGIYPSVESARTSNPRDLVWQDFEQIECIVGTVQEIDIFNPVTQEDDNVCYRGKLDLGNARGVMPFSVWFRDDIVPGAALLEALKGRQVLATTNLEQSGTDDRFDVDSAAILTVNGITTVEPAKKVENGFKLA